MASGGWMAQDGTPMQASNGNQHGSGAGDVPGQTPWSQLFQAAPVGVGPQAPDQGQQQQQGPQGQQGGTDGAGMTFSFGSQPNNPVGIDQSALTAARYNGSGGLTADAIRAQALEQQREAEQLFAAGVT